MVNYLFPYKYKKVGYFLFLIGTSLFFLDSLFNQQLNMIIFKIYDSKFLSSESWFEWSNDNILNELSIFFLFIGSMLSLFSREIVEDEFITKIRLESLVLGIYINIIILLLLNLIIFGTFFLTIILYSVFTYLVFAFIIFHYKLYIYKKELNNEE